MFILGLCYEHGQGVGVNIAKAKDLFAKAAALGDKPASDKLARLEANRA